MIARLFGPEATLRDVLLAVAIGVVLGSIVTCL